MRFCKKLKLLLILKNINKFFTKFFLNIKMEKSYKKKYYNKKQKLKS